MKETINEFREVIDLTYGTYLDASSSFPLLKKDLERRKQESTKSLIEAGVKEEECSERIDFGYARLVKANSPKSRIHLHNAPIDELIDRNKFLGKNTIFVARMAIITIYNFWEDHIRVKLQKKLCTKDQTISSQVMGDIGCIRNMIVHHRSIADKTTKNIKILKWFKKNELIEPSKPNIESMIDLLLDFCDNLESNPSKYIMLKPIQNKAEKLTL